MLALKEFFIKILYWLGIYKPNTEQNTGMFLVNQNNTDSAVGETIPSSGYAYVGTLGMKDKNDYTTFYSNTTKNTADLLYQSYVLRRKLADDSEISNGFYIRIAADGTRSVTFTSGGAEAWRKGLSLDDLFQIKQYSYTYNIAASGRTNITGTNFGNSTPAGYTPVALAYYTTGSQYVFPMTINPTATGSSQVMALKNTNSSAVSNATAYIKILYMRTDFGS